MFFQDDSVNVGGRGMAACAGQVASFNDGHVLWYDTEDLISWPAFNGNMMVPEDSVYGAE